MQTHQLARAYAAQHKETCNPEPKVVLKQNDIEKITVILQPKQTKFEESFDNEQEAIANAN